MAEVWVFNGPRSHFPSGVFSTREEAEAWIGRHNLTGTLTRYPLGIGAYEWAVQNGYFTPATPEQSEPSFIANFSSASLEHIHFEPEG